MGQTKGVQTARPLTVTTHAQAAADRACTSEPPQTLRHTIRSVGALSPVPKAKKATSVEPPGVGLDEVKKITQIKILFRLDRLCMNLIYFNLYSNILTYIKYYNILIKASQHEK